MKDFRCCLRSLTWYEGREEWLMALSTSDHMDGLIS